MKITAETLKKVATLGGKVRFNEKMKDMYIPKPTKSMVTTKGLRSKPKG